MKNVKQIIADYKAKRKINPDVVIADCVNEKNLGKVLEMAALARDEKGNKHPHQHRLPNKILQAFSNRVIQQTYKIRRASSFDELYSIIESCSIKGVGELAIYDTTHRIGARLGIRPDKVYMHQGTRVGAENYLKRKVAEKKLEKSFFKDFSKLSCEEIEDILCIYKGSIMNGKCLLPNRPHGC